MTVGPVTQDTLLTAADKVLIAARAVVNAAWEQEYGNQDTVDSYLIADLRAALFELDQDGRGE